MKTMILTATYITWLVSFVLVRLGECSENGDVRLVGGHLSMRGNVQVYYDGRWGMVCDDSWDDSDATVVCRQLGLSDIGSSFGGAEFGLGISPIWLDDVYCNGDETTLQDCSHNGWENHNCGVYEAAGVLCSDVRLVGGHSSMVGNVQVFYDGRWGMVCNDSWDDSGTKVACRQLGLSYIGSSFREDEFELGSYSIWLDNVNCNGDETTLQDCSHNGWENHNCNVDEAAGVVCGGVRLVGSVFHDEGRVEVFDGKSWGTVCDNEWDDTDASVICKQLNLSDTGFAFSGAVFGEGSGDVLLDNVECTDSDSNIFDCASSGLGNYSNRCPHSRDAAVSCHGPGLVRLDGGNDGNYDGRVQFFHEGRWRAICSDHWTIENTFVVCRHFGHGTVGRKVKGSYYGNGNNGEVRLNNVHCNGNEVTIFDCDHADWGAVDCKVNEDVGVNCYGNDTSLCLRKPCLNGGTCIIQSHGYICGCRDEYLGEWCEIQNNTSLNIQDTFNMPSQGKGLVTFVVINFILFIGLLCVVIFLVVYVKKRMNVPESHPVPPLPRSECKDFSKTVSDRNDRYQVPKTEPDEIYEFDEMYVNN